MLAAKVSAVLMVLLLVWPLGANWRASALLLLPESVNSQRQHGKLKGENVLKSMATVTPLALALLEPYTFTPLCPLAVVVTCRLLDVIAPALFIPAVVDVPSTDSEPLNEAAPLAPSVVAAMGPEIVEELLKVPVLATPVRFEGPEALSVVAATGPEIVEVLLKVPVLVTPVRVEGMPTLSVPLSVQGPEALSVVAAIGPEIVPVEDSVPVLDTPFKVLVLPTLSVPLSMQGPETLRVVAATGPEIEPVEAMVPALVKDPLIVRLPTGERYIAGLPELSAVTAYGDELVLAV